MDLIDPADLLKQALTLKAEDRAALAERLLASLDDLSEDETALLWAEEAERRLRAYRDGRAAGIPAEEVRKKAEGLFR